jgi:putative peptidoglycan lipid II flippase
VGVLSVGVYVALVLLLRRPLGIFSLMVADSVKQITHALVTGAWLSRRLGGFRKTTLWPTLGKILIAAAAMGLSVAGVLLALDSVRLPSGFARYALEVAGPGLVGVGIYFALISRLNIGEAHVIASLVRQKLGV